MMKYMIKTQTPCLTAFKTIVSVNFETPIAIGIDVAKNSLMICYRYADNHILTKNIGNNDSDIKKLIKELKLLNFSGKIVSESTGRFHMLSAVMLSEKNFLMYVINPLMSKKYNSASIRKVKSDKRDAEILAEIAIKEEKLPDVFTADRKKLMIKKKISLVATMDKQIQAMQATVKEYQETAKTLKIKLTKAEKGILGVVKNLKEEKEKLEKEIENIFNEQSSVDAINIRRQEIFSSIPGVSNYAATLTTVFFLEDHCQNPKQWIAYSGLDISVKQSGQWVGKGKLTKRGNGYLRKRLFSAAWGTIMHDAKFKEYYNYLREKKHSYVESLLMIARKIIRIMFYLSKNNCMYNPNKIVFTTN